jgi:hypothetical protein
VLSFPIFEFVVLPLPEDLCPVDAVVSELFFDEVVEVEEVLRVLLPEPVDFPMVLPDVEELLWVVFPELVDLPPVLPVFPVDPPVLPLLFLPDVLFPFLR